MKLISLKASNGHYWKANPAQNGRIDALHNDHSPFWMEEIGGGKVYLRDLAHQGKYVEASPEGNRELFARLDAPTPNCIFTLIDLGDKKVAFLAPDGKAYVTCQSDGIISAIGTTRGPAETFMLEKAQKPAEKKAKRNEVEPLWDDHTHARIVQVATDLIFKNHIGRNPVRALYALFSQKPFKDALLRGLYDADYVSTYTGLFYKFHFYHPKTGQNYMGFGENAVTMGAKYCNEAIELGNELFRKSLRGQRPTDQEYDACGYKLGIASHFITDLTQPMHSSNFANIFADRFPIMNFSDWRHSGLENMTEELVVDDRYLDDAAAFSYDKFAPEGYGTPQSILHEAAIIANITFENVVRAMMPNPGVAWKKAQVKTIIDSSIKGIGLHSVARFLTYFAAQASNVSIVKPGTLYRIKGWDGRYVTKVDEWLKLEPKRNSTYQEFFFISQEDGRHVIVSNADRGKRMALTAQPANLYIAALRRPNEVDRNSSTFRLVSQGGHRIKILEFTNNELISVKTSFSWVGHLCRWTNDQDPTNFWELEEVGPIQLSETEPEEGQTVEIASAETIHNGNSKTVSVTLNFTL